MRVIFYIEIYDEISLTFKAFCLKYESGYINKVSLSSIDETQILSNTSVKPTRLIFQTLEPSS